MAPPANEIVSKSRATPNIALAIQTEMLKAVADSGQATLKAMLILNGGGAIAVLAFVGNVIKQPGITIDQAAAFAFVLRSLLFGAFFAVSGSATTYLSNLTQTLGWVRLGIGLMIFTICLGAASLTAFLIGGWVAADTFAIAPHPPSPSVALPE